MKDDLISRQAALDLARDICIPTKDGSIYRHRCIDPDAVRELLSAQPEQLTDDDFETIRIHLNAYKEKLCNQHRWKEAEKYQHIIDRFMAFAFAQPEQKTGKWNFIGDNMFECTSCGVVYTTSQLNGLRNYDTDPYAPKFCPNCGADMRGEQNE